MGVAISSVPPLTAFTWTTFHLHAYGIRKRARSGQRRDALDTLPQGVASCRPALGRGVVYRRDKVTLTSRKAAISRTCYRAQARAHNWWWSANIRTTVSDGKSRQGEPQAGGPTWATRFMDWVSSATSL